MKYLLDSNTLIKSKNEHYSFSFCPGFWDIIKEKNKSEEFLFIDMVINELKAGDDELKAFADELIRTPNDTDEIQENYTIMAQDLYEGRISQNYSEHNINSFFKWC